MNLNVDLWQFLTVLVLGPVAHLYKKLSSVQKDVNGGLAAAREKSDEDVKAAKREFYAGLKEVSDKVNANALRAKDEFASVAYLKDVESRMLGGISDLKVAISRLEDKMDAHTRATRSGGD